MFYGALFLIYGVHLPYLPLWLEWRGLTPSQIAIVTSAPFFLRLIATPSLAYLADRRGAHTRMIRQLAWATLASALLLSGMYGFYQIFAATLVLAISLYTITPLIETIAVSGVRLGLDYGRMRLWGSLTFIAASFAGGAAVEWAGRGIGVWLIAIGCAATVIAAYFLPSSEEHAQKRSRQATNAASDKLETSPLPSSSNRGIDQATALRLARHPLFITFLIAIGSVQAAHATFYTSGAIQWRSGGLSSAWIGTLWAIGVMTEVSLFAISRRLVSLLGPVRLLLIGASAAVVRWSAMSVDPSLGWLIPLQVLHGLTYGASHLGAIHFISRAVPQAASGTAQALYSTLATGLLQGAATLGSGWLYARYGGGTYLAMALLSSVGLAAGLILARSWSGGLLWDDEGAGRPTLTVRA